jgi:hypothetical protein
MNTLILQFIITISLISGITIGEIISTKVFGALKKKIYVLIELILFVAIIILATSTVQVKDVSYAGLYYLLIGAITIIFVRGIMTFGGIFSIKVMKALKIKNELDYIIGTRKALERRGFKEYEIKRILKEIGFPNKKIEMVFSAGSKKKLIKKV